MERLATATRERRYVRDEMIFQKGDRPTGMYLVVTGKVKEVCQSPEGGERIIEVLGPNQTCGEASLFLDSHYPFSAIALTNAHLLHIDKPAIDTLIDKHPGVVAKILAALSLRLYALVRDVESYTLLNPVQRVVAYLIELANNGGVAGDTDITLPAAKFVIASRLGISPEALSRAFRDLADAGLIDVRGSRVTICKMERLRQFGQ
jgi:CRP-like cAMP-binding protein